MEIKIEELMTIYKALYNRLNFLQNHPNISRWDIEYKDCSELLNKIRKIIQNGKLCDI